MLEKKLYIKIGSAKDLKRGPSRRFYKFLEMLPGILAWGTLLIVVILSWLAPVAIAFFIIAFDIYWLLKTLFLAFHLRVAFGHMKKIMKKDWLKELKITKGVEPFVNWQEVYHLVILPMYKESHEVVLGTFKSLTEVNYPKDKLIIILGIEERAGEHAQLVAQKITREFGDKFFKFLVTTHPDSIVGELAGKGSNETWAARQAKEKIIDPLGIEYENILATVFDVDTVFYQDYFSRLTHIFVNSEDRIYCSFQPIPVFNNNIWDAPSFSRVVAQSGTFWHMMQQERPERLATFSSHSMNFKTVVEMDFWATKNVSEDSRIFWQSLLYYDGRYRVVPLHYPVSMDANLAQNIWQTALNVYKQQRRWGWGVENIPYLLFGFKNNKKIPFKTKLFWAFNHLEGFWSWSTNALIIFLLGWLPLFLGGQRFNLTVLSYNLPQITRIIMTLAMVGLVSSAIYGISLLPARPQKHNRLKYLFMIVQWALMPVTIIIFGALPGLEAQTRLMFGRYMGFWVTPKARVAETKNGEKIIFSNRA